MDRETLLIKAINYDYPEQIPVGVNMLPSVWINHPEDTLKLVKKYPQFFGEISNDFDYRKHIPLTYRMGTYTDEWGCIWSNIEEGMESIVTGHPVKTREGILNLKIPECRDGRMPHGFMYLRILDLRGFEEAMIDFAEECDELQILIDKVTEYNCYQAEVLAKTNSRILYFGDDLGMQKGLAIGAEKWRKYFKPCFTKIYNIVRNAGKYVYMHTDGMIFEIIPDLFEAGVQIVNPQFRANGLKNLVDVCKGKHPVYLDLDRQMFPFATPKECAEHVRECVEAFYMPEGGFGISIEISQDVPFENIEALIQAADKYRFYKG